MENWVLLALKVEKGLSDDLRPFLAVIRHYGGPQGPPEGSQWTILCPLRSLDQIFYYGALSEGQGHFVLPKI